MPALAVTAAVIAPLTVRNLIVMDAPVVISTNLGDDLCIGRNPDAKGTYVESPYCGFGGRYAHVPRPEFETVRNDDNIRRALEYLVDHPARELHLLALRAFHLVRHDHDGLSAVESYGDDEFMHPRVRAWLGRLADGFFFVTLALALFGLPALARGRDARRLIALLALVALATVPLAFFGDPRFHVPAVPLLSIAAAVSAATLLARWRARGGGDRAGARLAGGR